MAALDTTLDFEPRNPSTNSADAAGNRVAEFPKATEAGGDLDLLSRLAGRLADLVELRRTYARAPSPEPKRPRPIRRPAAYTPGRFR